MFLVNKTLQGNAEKELKAGTQTDRQTDIDRQKDRQTQQIQSDKQR